MPKITRRTILKLGLAAGALPAGRWAFAGEETMKERIARIIAAYDAQGIHRTGTAVDNQSADWLAREIAALGVEPELDVLSMKRVEIKRAVFKVGDLEIEGVPLFDCMYTGADGVTGTLGDAGSDSDIGIVMSWPSDRTPPMQRVMKGRRSGSQKAFVVVADESFPAGGTAPMNAEHFREPFGPPVLQIPNDHYEAIKAAMASGAKGTVIAHCEYVDATAKNVQARVPGTNASLAPLVVMTPRSGWWHCASERGGGIAAFLEIMRAVKANGAARDVIFTANTGHELGHTGLDHYLEHNQSLIKDAVLWIHLGANFAARRGRGVRLQFSDEQARATMLAHLEGTGVGPESESEMGSRPLGEARNVYDGGGRFISILGNNALFHHPADRWPDAVDLDNTVGWCTALAGVAVELTREG
ncbi:MAG: hypothetical protein KDI19_03530 [Pseudomonadales bacterium]|nr:hypothetical protein [Pseudomonadales bacterium]